MTLRRVQTAVSPAPLWRDDPNYPGIPAAPSTSSPELPTMTAPAPDIAPYPPPGDPYPAYLPFVQDGESYP